MPKLYHYSVEPRKELKTLRQQINEGMFDENRVKDLDQTDKFYIDFKKELPYNTHISFNIDPLPVDIIEKHFPKESPYFKGKGILYEHVIDISHAFDEASPLMWKMVELTYQQIMMDFCYNEWLWTNVEVYKRSYYIVQRLLKIIIGEYGNDVHSLEKNVTKYRGTIRSYFEKYSLFRS